MLKRMIHFLLLPCSQTTLLIEMQQSGQLSFIQKLRLKLHLAICKWCRAYQKKSAYLDKILLKNIHKENIEIINDFDIEQLKGKIREKIKNN
ncbi:hypothetical protein SF1_34440 [Sphingobacterium faecium NBRC 15299]|jgi:hypothetical protein|uniref:hypothetical protein n=1 Tax=Sphingobacterium faecium TaxID=34087 RepID=UPI000D49C9FA|nr:hypothetical protein [Sphingobacterium faecium]PTX10028.1 hypothetical protein C8N37_10535 [Sphingobacterium faecium]GEM65462.1 hypothetical protein SF1_34440 [Sphingobacterium faecium NBRC 15299]